MVAQRVECTAGISSSDGSRSMLATVDQPPRPNSVPPPSLPPPPAPAGVPAAPERVLPPWPPPAAASAVPAYAPPPAPGVLRRRTRVWAWVGLAIIVGLIVAGQVTRGERAA